MRFAKNERIGVSILVSIVILIILILFILISEERKDEMMSIQQISTKEAPEAIGPYSQGLFYNGVIYTSGQIPINPQTGELVQGNVEEQTRQALDNLKAVLEASGSGLHQVLKTTLFIKDMNDFSKVNKVYAEYFSEPYPARSCVEVARLPKDVLVEIEAIAIKE